MAHQNTALVRHPLPARPARHQSKKRRREDDDDKYSLIIRGEEVDVYTAEFPIGALAQSAHYTVMPRPSSLANQSAAPSNALTAPERHVSITHSYHTPSPPPRSQNASSRPDPTASRQRAPQSYDNVVTQTGRPSHASDHFCMLCGKHHKLAGQDAHDYPACPHCPLRHISEYSCQQNFREILQRLSDPDQLPNFASSPPPLPNNDLLSQIMTISFNMAYERACQQSSTNLSAAVIDVDEDSKQGCRDDEPVQAQVRRELSSALPSEVHMNMPGSFASDIEPPATDIEDTPVVHRPSSILQSLFHWVHPRDR